MDILVISGFLGAGKTTFIKEIIKKTKRDYCILENEYGAINIDSSSLKENNTDLKVYEFTEGCICCSSKGEFSSSVLTISNTFDPDYLIVEPTGVGYLSSILNNLKKIKYERIDILNAITIVDGLYLYQLLNNKNLKNLDPCLKDQIEYASIVVVSKNERFNDNEKEKITEFIKEINPQARVINDKHYSLYDEIFFKEIFINKEKLDDRELTKKIKEVPVTNFSLKREINLTSEYELISILEDISRGYYGLINRAKGFIKIKDKMYHFEMVNGIYTLTEYIPENIDNSEGIVKESEVVFIGYSIEKMKLRNRFVLPKNNIS